jgi:hypothetical protein
LAVDVSTATSIQTFKGALFVLATTAILFVLLRGRLAALRAADDERLQHACRQAALAQLGGARWPQRTRRTSSPTA